MDKDIYKIYEILVSILGEAKNGFDGHNMQLEFPCPRCREKYGKKEDRKYNLSLNISKGRFQCWKCNSEGEPMHGSILKLLKMYGNEELANEYRSVIRSIRDSEMYRLNFSNDDFNIDTSIITEEALRFPPSYMKFEKDKVYSERAFKYLENRGIGWDIIDRFNIGYTSYQEDDKKSSYRIIIPSYDAYGEVNYWVGRDYLMNDKRVKYDNPKVEKKNIIFNEEKIQWDADITLVEGPFDHIVVPNSIPLLGKALNDGYKVYWDLLYKAKGKINIWLDGDAFQTVKETYSFLNHGDLNGRIRYIPTNDDDDPSSIYQKYGWKGIANSLSNARELDNFQLNYQ